MAEVFAAFGTISAFLQVVDFIAKLSSKAYDLSRASRDALREDIDIERLTREYKSLAEECAKAAKDAKENGRDQKIIKLGQECQRVAEKLLDELESFRVEASGSKIKRIVGGTRIAARVLARQKDIERQRRQLQELNSLLATRMLQDLWMNQYEDHRKHDGNSLFRSIRDPTKPNANNVAEVRLVVARKRISNILESLQFDKMGARQQAVQIAWPKTYAWALEDPSHGLATWLQNGHGIFWISGKAGSGKSTLMKYLCSQEKTQVLLRQWSGNRTLIYATFFFWYAASSLQNSIPGLLRSILYQILYEVPSLAQVAFPKHTDSKERIEWTDEDLLHGLEAITNDKGVHMSVTDKVFCFFIDGLDEYSGDHSKLTGLLKNAAISSNLKICVSSRPWNAFRSAFENQVPRIRLEDLTRSDITRYATAQILNHTAAQNAMEDSDKDFEELISEIVEKAEGVFLWVILAVKSVCDGVVEGDNIAFLRYRVSRFPSDLEEFFGSILQRVEPVYKHQTYQALKLAWIIAGGGISTHDEDEFQAQIKKVASFIDFWLIRQTPEGLRDPAFAYEGTASKISSSDLARMHRETRSFLSATCKDLLCVREIGTDVFAYLRVEFLHRTVYDFLNTPDMRKMIDERVPEHFKNRRILHLLNLKKMKYFPPTREVKYWWANLYVSSKMSLTTTHPDFCERYVQQFDCVSVFGLQQCLSSASSLGGVASFTSGDILAALISHGQHRFCSLLFSEAASRLLRPTSDFRFPWEERPGGQGLIWNAVLGTSQIKPFSVHDISIDLVRQLFNAFGRFTDFGILNGWETFLCQWKLANPPHCRDERSRDPEWHRVWQLAVVFLNHGASPDQQFSIEPSNKKSSGGIYTAKDHIFAHVPEDWLHETAMTNSMVRVAGLRN